MSPHRDLVLLSLVFIFGFIKYSYGAAPVFSPTSYTATIAENTATGVSVKALTVTDADGDAVTVAILNGDDPTTKFAVSTHEIQTSANVIDYDVLAGSNFMYTLVITGTAGVDTATATLVVTITGVNEDTPVWGTFSSTYNLAENSPVGTTIADVGATDADAGVDGQILYELGTITPSGGSGGSAGLFHLDQVTGILTTTSNTFDRDTATGGNENYQIIVKAVDQGTPSNSVDKTLTVTLTDYNDNTPTFSSSLHTYTLQEDTTASTVLITFAGTDNDITSTLTYSLEASSIPATYANHFELNGADLRLKAIVDLDPASNNDASYTLVVKVADGGTPELTSTTQVSVTVAYANEFTPSFGAAVTTSVQESAAAGTAVIASFVATDGDAGNDGTLTYSIISGNTNNKFAIDPGSGAISVAGTLDFETKQQYPLTIQAVDGGTTPKTGTGSVTIDITDVSDETPTCTTSSVITSILENAATGTTVTTLACSDTDASDTLEYSIASGNSESKFSIGTNPNEILLAQTVDYDAGTRLYALVVDVTDRTFTVQVPVSINVSPVNEDTITFPADITVSFPEDTTVGTTLATHAATDTDALTHGIVEYQIGAVSTSGGMNLFSIDPTSGLIKLAQPLDYETAASHTITVYALDGDSPVNTGSGTVIITVTDVNDITPSCNPASHVTSIAENTAATTDVISDFVCTDVDFNTLTYTLTQSPSNHFSLNTSGTPKLVVSTSPDYETNSAYQLEVTVKDAGTPTPLSTVVSVNVVIEDVNEGPVTFTGTPYTASISESLAVGGSVFTAVATDPDGSSTTFGNLVYSITNGNSDNKFSIDPDSGKIIVAGVLNAVSGPSYTLEITAADEAGGFSATANCAITVTQANDNAPTCTEQAFSIEKAEEGTAAETLRSFTCSDVDGDTLTYTLTSGDATYFNVSGSDLKLVTPIDYDTISTTEYPVTIQVFDSVHTIDITGSITITGVNEGPPVFTQTTYTVQKAEDTTPGSVITTVAATDPDKGESVAYTWVTSTTDFTLDQSSGQILLATNIDRETLDTYSLLVHASDGTNTVTATVALTVTDVNDNAPVFNPTTYSATLTENTASGAVVTVAATDADDAATNSYGAILYSITGGNTGSKFTIVGSTGAITVASALDYETATSYTLYVQAIDSAGGAGARSSTAVVTVNIDSVNEASPVFSPASYTVAIDEDSAVGLSLLQVAATDTDAGPDGEVFYSMTTHAKFYLNVDTGVVSLKESVDYEGPDQTYAIEVVAHDRGAVANSATANVNININDVNDNTPACTPNLQTVTFAENTALTSAIASLACTDADSTTNAALTYAIATVNGAVSSAPFTIDSSTGAITLATAFDYETLTAYTVLATATDGGTPSLATTATVQVTVTDINEHTPSFTLTDNNFSVSETVAVDTDVHTVAATDSDTANTITFSLNPTSSVFAIDASTGVIKTTAQIDYESLPAGAKTYSLVVFITDDGTTPAVLSTSQAVTVTVTDANDVTPIFSPSVYVASISENDATGKTVTTVTASDSDDATVTYSLVDTFTSLFSIDTNGNILIGTANQDYESATKSYTVVVHATDAASTNTGTATVHVEVTAYNEHTPVLAPASASVSLQENSASGTAVVDADATDADAGNDGVITYSLATVPTGYESAFAIDPTTGAVTVAGTIDMEAVTTNPLTITIDATDAGTTPGVLSAQFTLTLTITDANDQTPSCPSSLYSGSVAENTGTGTSVAQVACTDGDVDAANNVITYSINSGTGSSVFSIDGATGIVSTTASALDRETTDNYNLVIHAIDSGTPPLTGTTTVTIIITDLNDNDPTFTGSPYTVNFDETTAVGTAIATVVATDVDIGDAGTITYSISSGNVDSNMAIDSTSGVIKLVASLNYESGNILYTLEVVAADNLATIRSSTGTVYVNVNDINDVTPSCSPALQTKTFAEDTALGTSIATMTCSDTDFNTLSYVIQTVDGVATTTPFAIDATTGEITLSTLLDYETDTLKTVVIHVIDNNGASSLTGTATVNVEVTDVNEANPVFTGTPYTQSISESTAVGSSIYRVAATDADTANTVTFSLGATSTVFDIDPNTGDVFTKAGLNFESLTTYTLSIVVTDNGATPKSATTNLVITVTDVNDVSPVFNPAFYAGSISENDGTGTTVTTVVATDTDTASLTYAITSGNGDAVFRVEASGVVLIDSVTNLDYDSATKSYTLVVTADDGTHTASTTVIVTVTNYNDNTPIFATTSSTQTVPEGTAAGTNVVTVAATDADDGTDGDITYSITSGNGDGKFAIDPTSGAVTVAGTLDIEDVASYTINIAATDAGTAPSALSATYILTVTVSDVNDVTPVCTSDLYSATIAEDAATGTNVVQLTCSDQDSSSPNKDINTYTITSGNSATAFGVSATGLITSLIALDRETLAAYTLIVEVADNGASALTTTTTVAVTVTDINDITPSIAVDPYHFAPAEDAAIGTVLGTIAATDTDIGDAGRVTYSINSGNVDNKLEIDSSSGELKIVSELDFETNSANPYVLQINAVDNDATTKLTGTTTVSIAFTDVNDNTPTCTPVLHSVQFAEDTAPTTTLASLTCTDADSSVNADLEYSIVSVTGGSLTIASFGVDASGVVTTAAGTNFDFETSQSHEILIRVKDKGTTALSFTATVNVDVTDVNENDPVFQSTPYTDNVPETTAVGTNVYAVAATDADTADSITYSVNPSNTYFQIDPVSGALTTIASIDYDTLAAPKTIVVTIVATDNGSPARSATETVTFTITDANDGTPVFNPGFYTASIAETDAVATAVVAVTVTDIDDTAWTFSFASGNGDNVFAIDPTTGAITIGDVTNLDYDSATQSYVLVARAVDSGSNTGTATVAVEVTNVNDNAPVLSPTSGAKSLAENIATGTAVDDVNAVDSDSGSDGSITYAITSVTNSGTGKFAINPTTGVVTTSGALDREVAASYVITVVASDAGTNPAQSSDTYTLTVTITDENDVTPGCTSSLYSADVTENAAAGSVVQLTCTDQDAEAPNNAIATYTIASGNTGSVFSVSTTGLVETTGSLDRETLAVYTLVIEVADSGTTARTTTTTVAVTVIDANDNVPAFASSPYNFNIAESFTVGSTFGSVSADDLDADAAGTVTYTIASGDTDSKFSIDSSTGALTVNQALDFETASSNPYNLVLHGVDGGTTPSTGSTTAVITLTDANDNSPVCTPLLESTSVREDVSSLPVTVKTFTCTDADSGVNGDLSTYAIISVNGVAGTNPFSIDTSGAVRVTQALDYETVTSYSVLVDVPDGGTPSLTSTATLNVAVTNVNDNTPVFSSLPYTGSIPESTTVGTSVFKVTAADSDTGDSVTFSLQSPMTEFDVDPNTGDIFLKAAVDFDTAPTSYEIIVVATDDGTVDGPLSASATVTMAITNTNDGTPEFNPGVYAISVAENANVGDTVLTVTVTDIDSTTFTYSIVSGNTGTAFAITGTGTTADITVAAALDYDSATKTYSLVIDAKDPGNLSGTATINIEVTSYNEFTPVYTPASSTQTVAENSATGTTVVDVDATDADHGDDGTITYQIASGASGKFAIDPSTGVVTVSGNLDIETLGTYTVLIDAVDGGTSPGALQAQYTLTVTVTDVNDFSPSCSSSLYSSTIPEDSAGGTSVAQLTCTDADNGSPNNVITSYSIASGITGGEFLVSATGEVTTAAVTFDRETLDNYQLTIVVTDSGTSPNAMSTTTTLTISISDVNDNDPTFTLAVYNFNTNEDTALYTTIGTVAATDLDSGLAGSMAFSIFSGNTAGKFALDSQTGVMSLAAALDYELTTTTPYVLVVYAIDKSATFRTGSATVSITVNDVNDNSPVCTASLFTGTIAEGSATGTSVATVTCSDSDTVGSALAYSITSGQTEFSVDAAGLVTNAAVLDVETTASYDLTMQVFDGTLTVDVSVSVTVTDVNDNTPAFDPAGPYTVSIDENIAIGTTVYDVNAIDDDVTATTFIFTITSGNTNSIFTIGTSSGIIQLQKDLDRDSPLTPSYTLALEVADGIGAGTLTATSSIVININDLNDNYPSCDKTAYSATTGEDTATGTTLITPTCTDSDVVASTTLLYTITSGNGDSKFQVNTATGVLTLQTALDYETTIRYTLTITVDDQGTPGLVTTITMTIYVDPVNENTPVFTGQPYDTTVDEDNALGFQVVRVSATDADTGSTHGDVRYAITSGNGDGRFSLDPSTGWITIAGSLDRENIASYPLTVTASDMAEGDAAARTATDTFAITVADKNDNYPVINPASYAPSVNEDVTGVATTVVLITATDADEANAGTAGLGYTITNGNTGNVFTMTNNAVVVTGTIDAATQSMYILTVKVADQGTPVLSAFTQVSIQVLAVNEHTPAFTTPLDTITLSETTAVGTSVYQAAASDADTGTYAQLRYYLEAGNVADEFNVDPFNGDVRIANSLDFDTTPTQYILRIRVEDTESTTGFTRSATMSLTVTLTDENDETPTFTTNTYTGSVDENVANPTLVLTVVANDNDSGTNGAVTYSVLSGTGSTLFSIGSTTGDISTAANIDFETLSTYDLKVKATDAGTPQLSSTCVVRITINDLNDETPTFAVQNIAINILESTAIATSVATAAASDADSTANNNNVVAYSFNPGSAHFAIDRASGVITTLAALDRETAASHTLVVYAIDRDGAATGANTGSSTYTIVLTDVNDNPPVVTGVPYSTTIAEDTAANVVVFTITATDDDENENAVLSYSITAGNTNTDFVLDSGSGLLQVKNALDRETTDLYNIEVTIVDNGTPANTATVTATVTISDINDNNPIFQPDPITFYNFTVSENSPSGTSVDKVSATDADTGTNAAITYVISSFLVGDSSHFSLDGSTGVVSTAAALDRETTDLYTFIVRALDGGASTLTATATVTIHIEDFNDNVPQFSSTLYTANTIENLPISTSILTVVITDFDISVNKAITLAINTTTAAGARADLYLTADSATSIISVKQVIDRETDSSFSFMLIATDGGTPPLSFSTSVSITIGDENDNNPVFSPTFYNNEIAYNDQCQVTVATIAATDTDAGVNSALTYGMTQNDYPHFFSLNADSGVVTKIATTDVSGRYVMYASSTDGGSPALSSATGATIRVDTYNPSAVVLNYYMTISNDAYLVLETTFLSQLSTVYQVTYPTAQAKRWCVTAITTTSCKVSVYVIKDDTADAVSEIGNTKLFLTMDQAYAVTAADNAGTPAGVIQGAGWDQFSLYRVEKYYEEEPATVPWIETAAGIITVSVLSAVMFIFLLVVAGIVYYKCRNQPTGSQKNRVEIADDDGEGGDHVAKNQYKTKNNSLQKMFKPNNVDPAKETSTPMIKPYDKTHPPPAVVALPMPFATKKVPMQVGNRSIEKPRDVNLFSPDSAGSGTKLMKKPEKLRGDSPTSAEPPPVRPLPPTRKPPAPRPPREVVTGTPPPRDMRSLTPTDPLSKSEAEGDYKVLNRDFDGKAIDPATGRLYEYNTRTNERRWVKTPDGQQVKLTRDTYNDI